MIETPVSSSTRRSSLAQGLRLLLFSYVIALIATVSSERMFWYWDTTLTAHLEGGLFYALCAAPALWLISRFGVHNVWGMALVAAVFGYAVEGLVTPVMYSGGPMVPFFPLWFAAWHGGLSLWLLVFEFRRWLVQGNLRALTVASVGFGLLWGVWSITLLLPENVNDEELIELNGALQVLTPSEFALYAAMISATLIIGHWVLGQRLLGQPVWPTSFRPGPVLRWLWIVWAAGMLIGWTVGGVLWAIPMFVAYGALSVWGLRRVYRPSPPAPPSYLERLAGPVSVRALAPLALMPVVAIATYGLLWNLDLGDVAGRVIMYGIIVIQTLLAAAVAVRSLRWVFSTPKVAAAT